MYASRLGTKPEPKEITMSGRKHRIGTILFLLGAGLGLASCAGDVGYYSTAGPYPYGTYPYAEGFVYRGDWGYGHPHYWRHWDHRRAGHFAPRYFYGHRGLGGARPGGGHFGGRGRR
ncbi:MAG: hypothetical protein QOK29_1063 [Rhodospirillaceae bacterium]|jgi:hypothetical protein|nr:hypothetical protein [Rhodospirillaceae bacterium]